MWSIIILTLLAIFLIAFYHHYNRSTRLMNKIPGPRSWPIIGNSYKFFLSPEKLFKYQRSLVRDYGDVSQIYGMNVRMVNISNPNDVEKILSSPEYNYKEHPYTFFSQWLGSGLLLSNGKKWHQRRKILTKAFYFNILKKFMITFVEQSEYFQKKVQEELGKEKTNLLPLIRNTTLRVLCETTMGNSDLDGLQSSVDTYFDSIEIIGDCIANRLVRPWLNNESLFQLSSIGKTQTLAIEGLHTFTKNVINQRREYLKSNLNQFDDDVGGYESDKKLALLDLLLKIEKSGELNQNDVREEIDTFMFAGFDTTSTAMTFIILVIANYPEVQEKLYDELYKIFGDSDRAPTMEDLNDMKYLDCCIKETLRLYPSVPIIIRYLTKETNLGGYTVPANTSCFIHIYDLLRRADVFPEPERFIPERFLPENYNLKNPYSYIPFSAGPRNCIGQKFALIELKILISGLLRKFRLEPVTKLSDLTYKTDMVLCTTHPVYARFCLRQ